MTNFASPVRTSKGRLNLLPNPSFEADTTVASTYAGYPAAASLSVNTNTANVANGTKSLQVAGTSTAGSTVWFYAPGIPGAPNVFITAGVTYTFSCLVKSTQVARSWVASLIFYSMATQSLGTFQGSSTATTLGQWTQVSVTATAPAGATQVGMRMVAGSGSATEVNYIDGMLLEPSATALPYFDGNYDGGRWRGTAHASISESIGADLNSNLVQNVGYPVLAGDAASKSYVDTNLATGVRVTTLTQRFNLVTNPSFATGSITGWAPVGANATVAYYGSDSYNSTGSLQLGTNVAASPVAASLSIDPVTAGKAYTFSFYVKPLVGTSATGQARIDWYNGAGTLISSSTGTSTIIYANYLWGRLFVTGTAPANTVRATLTILSTGSLVTDSLLIDAVLFEQSSSVGVYFDGSTGNSRWLGTVSASVSEIIAFDANTTNIINVAPPSLGTDAANKAYVDAAAVTGSAAGAADVAVFALMGVY